MCTGTKHTLKALDIAAVMHSFSYAARFRQLKMGSSQAASSGAAPVVVSEGDGPSSDGGGAPFSGRACNASHEVRAALPPTHGQYFG